jgi:import inner membrane translocase subunit TIM8
MSAQQLNIDNADLEKLNDKDRSELRQFLANEQQRSQIQARTSSCKRCIARDRRADRCL